MLKRFLLCAFLLTAAFRASATDYTDLYYVPGEEGWGFNVVQSDSFLFLTFFIYGPDNKPTWYTAQLTFDSSGNYNGKLYATTGTYYAMPWSVPDSSIIEVGTASFQPTSAYTAKLIYVVTKPANLAATVTKAVRRQTLTKITLDATYVGGQSGALSGSNCGNAGPYTDTFDLVVTQPGDGTVTFTFDYNVLQSECKLSGTPTQFGQLYTMPATTYKCTAYSDGHTTLNTNASMSEIKATSLGIEAKFSAPDVGGGCAEAAAFSAVLR